MNSIRKNCGRTKQILPEQVFFPEGLIGLPDYKNFSVAQYEDLPLIELRSLKEPQLGFWALNPFVYVQNYRLDINDEDVEFLNIKNKSEIIILTLAIISQHKVALNLMAPLCIHRKSCTGRQIVPENYKMLSTKQVIYEEAVQCLS